MRSAPASGRRWSSPATRTPIWNPAADCCTQVQLVTLNSAPTSSTPSELGETAVAVGGLTARAAAGMATSACAEVATPLASVTVTINRSTSDRDAPDSW